MVSLTVRHPDGSTETIPETTEWARTRELGKMRRARITVERSLAESVSLTKKRDIIELGNVDTLVLVDIETGGSTWTLVCYSFEWLANRYPFFPGGAEREGDDNTLITNLISGVSEWSAGTIGDFTGPMSFVFNHAHRHDALRRIERNTPGELRFYDEGTIDYVDSLGTDKSGSVELSGSAGTIEESINITERGREYDGTHVRLIGAHEGEAQYSANLVPDADPYDYEGDTDFSGVVRYTTPRWTEEADTDWDIWKNKDVADQQTIEEEAAALGEELQDTLVEAKTTVVGPDLSVGDYVQVVKPSANLNRKMRVHRIKEVVQGATSRDKVLLSTRTTMRQSGDEQLEGIRQFNTSFQGSSVAVNGGPIRGAVDDGQPLEFGFRYPDLEYENAAELHVKALPYRIDSKGAASGGGEVATSDPVENSQIASYYSNSGEIAVSNGDTLVVDSTTLPTGADGFPYWFNVTIGVDASATEDLRELDAEIYPTGGSTVASPIQSGGQVFRELQPIRGTELTSTDLAGEEMNLRFTDIAVTGSSDLTLEYQWAITAIPEHTHDVTISPHTHDPQAGIFETGDTVTDLNISINGSDSGAGFIGSGTFETVIDISGEMNPDSWNDFTVYSSDLGLVQVTVFVEGYDKIGTQS
jgi:hypothetical protein